MLQKTDRKRQVELTTFWKCEMRQNQKKNCYFSIAMEKTVINILMADREADINRTPILLFWNVLALIVNISIFTPTPAHFYTCIGGDVDLSFLKRSHVIFAERFTRTLTYISAVLSGKYLVSQSFVSLPKNKSSSQLVVISAKCWKRLTSRQG